MVDFTTTEIIAILFAILFFLMGLVIIVLVMRTKKYQERHKLAALGSGMIFLGLVIGSIVGATLV